MRRRDIVAARMPARADPLQCLVQTPADQRRSIRAAPAFQRAGDRAAAEAAITQQCGADGLDLVRAIQGGRTLADAAGARGAREVGCYGWLLRRSLDALARRLGYAPKLSAMPLCGSSLAEECHDFLIDGVQVVVLRDGPSVHGHLTLAKHDTKRNFFLARTIPELQCVRGAVAALGHFRTWNSCRQFRLQLSYYPRDLSKRILASVRNVLRVPSLYFLCVDDASDDLVDDLIEFSHWSFSSGDRLRVAQNVTANVAIMLL